MFYIATYECGRGVRHITPFNNKKDFLIYADHVLSMTNAIVNYWDSIAVICEKLHDNGIGYGSRFHYRISMSEIKKHGLFNRIK
tara:strand:- start:67 stop:318 length:252 start_codon:yes stop_codon:yes gene_type:complete